MADTNIPDFSKLWAESSPTGRYPISDQDYLKGFAFVGSTPPARQIFDEWMYLADRKMLWMYNNMFSEDSMAGYLYWRLPSTAYFVGEKMRLQQDPLDIYLECTVAGESSADKLLKLPDGKKVGDTLQDGTVTWVVRQIEITANRITIKQVIDMVYPVGSIFETTENIDPNTKWAGTTWEKMDAGRVLISSGEGTDKNGTKMTFAVGDADNVGEYSHQLTTGELASHAHVISTTSLMGSFGQASWGNYGAVTGIVSSRMSGSMNGPNGEMSQSGQIFTINADHTHRVSNNGSSSKHNNLMPYIVVHRWKRTS